ncbi:MAG: putative nucleotide-diphospho-sugar transferase [Candidatus Paceibacterota bacterium]|jgi:hypothetical protein
MLRLTFQRHAAYAMSHKMDYQCYIGDYALDKGVLTGAWHKIKMIIDALERGYEYVFWLDTDTAIVGDEDLRNAFTDKFIGCCEHKSDKFPKEWQVPTHLNVGVVFVKNGKGVLDFMRKWWDSFPGDKRWMEQGSFNELVKESDLIFKLDDRFNATVNVNEVEKPVILGWHGIQPASKRFSMMKATMYDDHIKYKV